LIRKGGRVGGVQPINSIFREGSFRNRKASEEMNCGPECLQKSVRTGSPRKAHEPQGFEGPGPLERRQFASQKFPE